MRELTFIKVYEDLRTDGLMGYEAVEVALDILTCGGYAGMSEISRVLLFKRKQ